MSNFSGIKIGDTIAVIDMYGLTKAVVDAVTPATFVAGNQRFNKSNGSLRGEEGLRRTLAKPWTQKHDDLLLKRDAQEKKQGIVRRLRTENYSALNDETLARLVSIIEDAQAAKNTPPPLVDETDAADEPGVNYTPR